MPQTLAKPRIGLLLGDPSGIGPELAAKLLQDPETLASAAVTLIGDPQIYAAGAAIAGAPPKPPPPVRVMEWRPEGAPARYPPAQVSEAAGAYALGSLEQGADLLSRGELDALVYSPLNKQAMKIAGLEDEDETHFFARLLKPSGLSSEVNIAGALWTTRVTSHVPLRAVAGLITRDRVTAAIRLLHDVLKANGLAAPRIAVAGLNPHAGEGGLLGSEEVEIIAPAVEDARATGIAASGPYPADTLFIAARRGDFDGVVTMYHDQGQIATKLMGFERGVTLIGGLPFPICTPAHGTAFDIAGKGSANPGPIREAFRIAVRLTRPMLD